jgi:hypothetical protein
MIRIVFPCVLAAAFGPAQANDMYNGVASTPGVVQIFAVPLDGNIADLRQWHPLRQGRTTKRRAVVVSAVRPGVESPLATLRVEVPLDARVIEPVVPAAAAAVAARHVDFNVDLGMYSGRTRMATPRYDPTAQLTPADLDGDPATLRDSNGRIRPVPKLSVGMNVRF